MKSRLNAVLTRTKMGLAVLITILLKLLGYCTLSWGIIAIAVLMYLLFFGEL